MFFKSSIVSPKLDQGHFLFRSQRVSTFVLHNEATEGSRARPLSRTMHEPSHLKAAAQGPGPHPRSPLVISQHYIPSVFVQVIMHMLLQDMFMDFLNKERVALDVLQGHHTFIYKCNMYICIQYSTYSIQCICIHI